MQVIHGRILGGVDQRPTFAAKGDKAGVPKLVEMKGQGCGRHAAEPVTNATDRQPFGTGLDQQAENIETGFLSERGQSGNSVRLLHISRMIEIWLPVKGDASVQNESRQLENADPDPVNRLSFFVA